MFKAALLAASMLAAAPALAQAAPPPAAATAPSDADARLKALYDAEWEWRRGEFGTRDEDDGLRTDRYPRVDPASQQRRLAYWQSVLKQVDAIPADRLSDEERVNQAVFRAVLAEEISDIRYKTYEAPFNSDSFFWTDNPPQRLGSAETYRLYAARLKGLPRYFDEQIANMRAGLARGYTPARVSLEGREKTIEAYLKPGAGHPHARPLANFPANIPEAERAKLRAEIEAVIASDVVPAYAKLHAFLRDEYLPKARTELAASKLPDGAAFYKAQIEKFTTLDLSAEEIHKIGLAEVARIKAEMEEVMRKAGHQGDLASFIAFLRTDPQFYAKTPHELMAEATYIAKKADGQLKHIIGRLPRYRHGVIPVPDAIAPIYTSGRGGLENCLFNTYNLPARPMYNLPALALHECTPGHSFQAALALEGPARPEFRKRNYFSGYGEGWGLYTEWLGIQMGIYETPYQDFGRLTYEMWRAARLVIDTGIHHYGWDRQKAIDYLAGHTALSELEVVNEIDRYISWPGQALAYKLGEITIKRLRAEAEAKLGDRFDQRWFHDKFLYMGSVPLATLESEMRRWIAAGGPDPYAGSAD